MISDNSIHPKTYEVSKVTELVPAGVIKLTMKQKPYDEKRDNVQLRICDYYNEYGEPYVGNSNSHIEVHGKIHRMVLNNDNELEYMEDCDEYYKLPTKKTHYFFVKSENLLYDTFDWKIKSVDESKDETFSKMVKINNFGDGSMSLRINRTKELIGLKFILSAYTEDCAVAEIELEVTE